MSARKKKRAGVARLFGKGSGWYSKLPVSYQEALVTSSLIDSLESTAIGLLAWRESLLEGEVPSTENLWPKGKIGITIAEWFNTSGVLPHCTSNPDLVDLVVLEMLKIILECQKDSLSKIEKLLRQWVNKERVRRKIAEQENLNPSTVQPITEEEKLNERNRIQAKIDGESAGQILGKLNQLWSERINAWNSVYDVFGEMGKSLRLGWDLSRGVLKMTGWENVLKIHNLLKSLPQITDIARAIGRLREAEGEDIYENKRVVKAISRVVEELKWVKIPTMRSETDGVHKSADVQRMLPAESMLMRHPQFSKLWKARLLERNLATYRIVGYGYEKIKRTETEDVETDEVSHRKLERGPIIACLDTSGSMQGVPELVAKAITFELMRLAASESRKCFLYTFSGPGNLEGKELSLSPDGLNGIIGLLSMSFGGGTDISDPMNAAISKVSESGWSRSDIVMVSDGEFHVPSHIQNLVNDARSKISLRVHGLIVVPHRNNSSNAMKQLCNPLHYFTDWQSIRGF
jgi:uncharacterized protein with von Willebrand factor type A (vWA) domain